MNDTKQFNTTNCLSQHKADLKRGRLGVYWVSRAAAQLPIVTVTRDGSTIAHRRRDGIKRPKLLCTYGLFVQVIKYLKVHSI